MEKIDEFSIDYFYDIIDVLIDGKMILKEYVLKLFSSVEKGIIILKKISIIMLKKILVIFFILLIFYQLI